MKNGNPWKTASRAIFVATALMASATLTRAEEPIKIGMGIAQTGPLAGSGKSAILSMNIWVEDTNAKGGLLGRPVKLIYYDDQSNPANVPSIYTKLIDIDKVDLIVSGYATPIIAAAMPIAMQHNMVLMGLFGLADNARFHYDKYFGIAPIGENPSQSSTKPIFDLAMKLNPKPKTVAVITPELEFGHAVLEGVRQNAKELGLTVVYDRTFPPATTDLTTVVREVQASHPDLVVVGTQPGQTISAVRAVSEVGLKAMMIGGAMTGLQTSPTESLLGPQLNGFVNFNYWLPSPKMQYPGVMEFLGKYQARAEKEGVDPLGYYIGPWAYADLQILGQAVEATKSLDGAKLGPYIHATNFKTVVGDVKFGPGGEWEKPRILMAQFQHVSGNDIAQFKGSDKLVVVDPPEYKAGDMIYPFQDARQ
jgi:branched-chain amino acid transport system substrate-binding protein